MRLQAHGPIHNKQNSMIHCIYIQFKYDFRYRQKGSPILRSYESVILYAHLECPKHNLSQGLTGFKY